jgi:hypothetical protein
LNFLREIRKERREDAEIKNNIDVTAFYSSMGN